MGRRFGCRDALPHPGTRDRFAAFPDPSSAHRYRSFGERVAISRGIAAHSPNERLFPPPHPFRRHDRATADPHRPRPHPTITGCRPRPPLPQPRSPTPVPARSGTAPLDANNDHKWRGAARDHPPAEAAPSSTSTAAPSGHLARKLHRTMNTTTPGQTPPTDHCLRILNATPTTRWDRKRRSRKGRLRFQRCGHDRWTVSRDKWGIFCR